MLRSTLDRFGADGGGGGGRNTNYNDDKDDKSHGSLSSYDEEVGLMPKMGGDDDDDDLSYEDDTNNDSSSIAAAEKKRIMASKSASALGSIAELENVSETSGGTSSSKQGNLKTDTTANANTNTTSSSAATTTNTRSATRSNANFTDVSKLRGKYKNVALTTKKKHSSRSLELRSPPSISTSTASIASPYTSTNSHMSSSNNTQIYKNYSSSNVSEGESTDAFLSVEELYGSGANVGGTGMNSSRHGGHRKFIRQALSSTSNRSNLSSLAGASLDRDVILAGLESASQGDAMAAAAAVVQRGMVGQYNYKKGEHVLIAFRTLSEEWTQNMDDEVDQTVESQKSTVELQKPTGAPVNKYGYPAREGRKEMEKRGPYVYVIATVREIHFKEDARHYTVERHDTRRHVRAETGWMEPIKAGSDGEKAALAAAQRKENKTDKNGDATRLNNTYVKSIYTSAMERIEKIKDTFQDEAEKIVTGSNQYNCEIRLSTVNFVVVCSLIVSLFEQLKLAFFSRESDFAIDVIFFIAWIVLVIELFFRRCIRPDEYFQLIKSAEAYNPSTARYINTFHLVCEGLALIFAVPNFLPLFGVDPFINSVKASIYITMGGDSFGLYLLGHLYIFTTRLRLFCLVRYKTNHWIDTIHHEETIQRRVTTSDKTDESTTNIKNTRETKMENENIEILPKAARIATALLQVNAQRSIILILFIAFCVPFFSISSIAGPNTFIYDMTDYLHQINTSDDKFNCDFINNATLSWANAVDFDRSSYGLHQSSVGKDSNLVRVEVSSGRNCKEVGCKILGDTKNKICLHWAKNKNKNLTLDSLHKYHNARQGSLVEVIRKSDSDVETKVLYNVEGTVSLSSFNSFLLQVCILGWILINLSFLRNDAKILVITPLRRLLRIVLRYSTNPLADTKKQNSKRKRPVIEEPINESDLDFDTSGKDKVGGYETERLITAVTKITDLLRKCWGVAGAGIISSNLQRNIKGDTVVFNPTVPGKLVYALFGFVGINDYGHFLKNLDNDVMDLISDIAKVLHNEVYRWGLGDSGQCNKNLGGAFLMVFRIGDVDEVRKKNDEAKKVIFSSQDTLQTSLKRSKKAISLENELKSIQLSSLPGINAFGDRAILGLLKAFTGINREPTVKNWENDYRLGAGVGAISIGLKFGMDAGWAVEGAVGSQYKVDATYLSSHVNMASRMMSACKQYRLTILLSKAVQELVSKECRKKLRHIDTVYVKGSKMKQQVYTYDARATGVDFFLNSRTEEQATREADRYTPQIWQRDQDLQEIRAHVTRDFSIAYENGLKLYLLGKWKDALHQLERANELMIRDYVDSGRVELASTLKRKILDISTKDADAIHMREVYGDGPCMTLIAYIKNRDCKAPSNWDGVRELTSK